MVWWSEGEDFRWLIEQLLSKPIKSIPRENWQSLGNSAVCGGIVVYIVTGVERSTSSMAVWRDGQVSRAAWASSEAKCLQSFANGSVPYTVWLWGLELLSPLKMPSNLALVLQSCGILGKVLNYSEPQFFIGKMGTIRLFWRFNDIKYLVDIISNEKYCC